MELELRLPQLETLAAKIDEVVRNQKAAEAVSACTDIDTEACLTRLEAIEQKLDALILAAATPGPVSQPEPPQSAPAERAPKRGRTQKAPLMRQQTAAEAMDEDHRVEDEDTLRARVDFEAKRTTRQFGIGATRAAIKRIAGDGVLRVDDVPAVQLPLLLTELQAL
jgi:hypothetical protein